MKKLFLLISFCLCSASVFSQQVPVIKFADFDQLRTRQNDTTYVFNFWATWCRPCVAELPYFEEMNKANADKKIKVVLISLDFKRQLDGLNKFVSDRKIQSQVYLLDELNYNSWIDKIDTTWSGAIPITLIINNKKQYHKFYEKGFTLDELEKAINEVH